VSVSGIIDGTPTINFTQDGSSQQIECDYVVGADGSQTYCRFLIPALGSYYTSKSTEFIDAYTATALRRVWRCQHFSWWMTSMLHRFGDASDFDLHRQLAELDVITSSRQGSALLAEQRRRPVGLNRPLGDRYQSAPPSAVRAAPGERYGSEACLEESGPAKDSG
jgi:2-polyprenyl-6-methoxyphenol hydroxylase-like FAD-dependent oxidoreductase